MKSIFLSILLVTGLSILTGCSDKIKPGEAEVQRQLVEGIEISEVRPSVVKDFYETSGTLRARNTAMVSAKLMGIVKEVKVKAGQEVKKGDPLLVINSPDIEARVQAAEEAVEEARSGMEIAGEKKELMEKTFRRFKKLYEGRALTEQEFDEIRTRRAVALKKHEMAERSLKRAEASLEEAKAFREYLFISSPMDGVIADKKIDIGSMTSPGVPLFIIEDMEYRIEADADERLLNKITTGMKVNIFIDSLELETTGEVEEIVRRIDRMTRTFTVKITPDIISPDYRGGLWCRISFPAGERSGLLIPSGAVMQKGDLTGVYTVDNMGVIAFRLVRTGKTGGDKIEILSGLAEGERIVTGGIEKAFDGGRI